MAARKLLIFGILAALGAIGWSAWHAYRLRSTDAGLTVAVFLPGPNEGTWADFVEGVRLAANEVDATVEQRPQSYECVLNAGPLPIVFQWCPEVGARHIQRRVRELCTQRNPPVAFVGSSNSELTRCLGSEIRRSAEKSTAPLLLMTNATADDLIDLVPDRTFRFGFNNGRQAKVVVERLREFFEQKQRSTSDVKAIVLRVADDEFSVDLANRFAAELKSTLHAKLSPPPIRFLAALAGADAAAGASQAPIWTLGTATGRFDEPSPAEWELARRLLEKIIVDLDSQWVVALPAGTSVYRRFAYATSSCLREMEDRSVAERVRNQLVLVSGDSLDYYAFRECQLNQLQPEEAPGPIIFFSHANPLDRSVAPPPNRHIPARSLNREVARLLIAAVRSTTDRSAAGLARVMQSQTASNEQATYFEGGERRGGGGAVVAIPRPEKQRDFELLLPKAWQD